MLGKKILLVDDDREIIEKLKLPLQVGEFEVIEAYDGLQALDMIRSEKPDLVVLDIVMPRLDGLKVTRLFKFDERYQDIPVILITHVVNQDQSFLEKMHVHKLFMKPFKTDEVLKAIKEILGES